MNKLTLLILFVFISSTAFAAQWVTLAKRVDGTVYRGRRPVKGPGIVAERAPAR